MHRATQHAIYSAMVTTTATATFMLLPSFRGTNAYQRLIHDLPKMCTVLGTLPADKLEYAKPARWNGTRTLPTPKWGLKLIAIWNQAGKDALATNNATWLEDLATNIPEAIWHQTSTSALHNSACLSGQPTQCPRKFRKLRPDHKLFHSSPNHMRVDVPPIYYNNTLILKVPDWKQWAYTDGSCIKPTLNDFRKVSSTF